MLGDKSSPTTLAIALAAANRIIGVMQEARTSKAPRKIPGKANTLLI